MTADSDNFSARLRAQPSLTGTAPHLDLEALPDDPMPLFAEWVRAAMDAGVVEPLAMTLATVDADGMPDARTLILKDASVRGIAFAGPRSSRKGEQLAANPVAAVTLWWQPQLRTIRARGRVVEATPAESAADFAARSAAAKNGMESEDWVLWRVVPSRVEFWQGSADRRHLRVVYDATASGWARTGTDLGG